MKNTQYRFYVQVKDLDNNEVKFVDIDSSSGGYPYASHSTLPSLLTRKHADRILDDVIAASQGRMTEMSDGGLSLPYSVSFMCGLDNEKRSARVKAAIYEVTDNTDGLKVEFVRSVTFEAVEGEGFKERDKTKLSITQTATVS